MLTRTPDATGTGHTLLADPPERNSVVLLADVPWAVFEALLKSKRDAPVPRYAYLNGDLEIVSPGRAHERTKTNLGRLIEAFGMLRDVPVTGMGSWTLKNRLLKKGVEPDECDFIGRSDGEAPDLAIEVVMASDALDKLTMLAPQTDQHAALQTWMRWLRAGA